MILYLPKHFDENEWFILVSMAIMFLLICLFPKRLHFVHVLSIWLLNIYLAYTVDYSLDHPPTFLYFSNDSNKYEVFDSFIYYILYPGSMYLFITGLVSFPFLRKHRFLYVCCVCIVTAVVEYFAHLMHVFTYVHWSIWYSLIAYIPLFSINVGFYYFVSNHVFRLHNQNSIDKPLAKR